MSTRHIDVRSLELLSGIEQYGSVAAASRRAGMAPPDAGRHIRHLERRFGTQLLQRNPTGSTLTPHGRTIMEAARKVLEAISDMVAVAEGLRHDEHAQLDVCASTTIAEQLMPVWLNHYRGRFPDVGIHLQVRNSTQVLEQVHDGCCHLGFVECPDVPEFAHSAVVAHDRLVVVVNSAHPWARRAAPITVSELAATPLLVREVGSGTRMTIDRALDGHTASPLLELGSTGAIRNSVLAGIGPAVVSGLAVADDLASGALRQVYVHGLKLERTLRAVWRADRPLSRAAHDLVSLVTSSGESRCAGR
ncbi:LysR family transcriptional regulator [Rhodococcus aetherivorans]